MSEQGGPPCPFCKSVHLTFLASGRTMCENCGAVAPKIAFGKLFNVTAQNPCWGSRPLESALQSRVASLQRDADTLRQLILDRGDLKLQARVAELERRNADLVDAMLMPNYDRPGHGLSILTDEEKQAARTRAEGMKQ